MARRVLSVLIASLCLVLVLAYQPADAQDPDSLPTVPRQTDTVPSPDAFVPGRLLLTLSSTDQRMSDAAVADTVRSLATDVLRVEPLAGVGDTYLVSTTAGSENVVRERLLAAIVAAHVEPDYLFHKIGVTPNDTLYSDFQWNLRHINAEEGWSRTTGSSDVIIAVVDTGVDLTHPDLQAKLVQGYDSANGDADPSDDDGHGTHVASIAAASTNNGAGISGVAWGARIMPIKVLSADGNGSASGVAQGIIWAVDHGADIINLSLGGPNSSLLVKNAIEYADTQGVLVVAAAGNHYKEGNPTTYPAAYDRVLAVAATNDSDGHASYSNSGSYIDVAAPGGDPVNSFDSNERHWIPGAYWQGAGTAYAQLSGTSQAAPHVAGLAALLLSVDPALSPGQLTQIISSSARDVQAPGWDPFSGYGRIDVAAALSLAQHDVPSPTPSPGATAAPSATWTPEPSRTPSPSPTPTETATPTHSPTPRPTPTATAPARGDDDQRINNSISGPQSGVALASDPAGNTIAIWRDGRSASEVLFAADLPAAARLWGPNVSLFAERGGGSSVTMEQIADPAVALGADGWAHAIWYGNEVGSDERRVYHSYREAAEPNWSVPRPASTTILLAGFDLSDNAENLVSSRPVLRSGPDGTLMALWQSTTGVSPLPRLYSSQWTAETGWTQTQLVFPFSGSAQLVPTLAQHNGRFYAAWVEWSSSGGQILLAEREFEAVRWNKPELVARLQATSPAQFVLGADANSQHIALVWTDGAGTDSAVLWSMRELSASTWSARQAVSPVGAPGVSAPAVALNERGMVVVWEESAHAGDIFARWLVSNVWSAPRRINRGALQAVQTAPDVTMDANGHTTVAWLDHRTGDAAPEIYARSIPAGERFGYFAPVIEK